MNARQQRINQDITRAKTQRLVNPKKARKVFNQSIADLAKDAYVKILKRRILIWIIITGVTNVSWVAAGAWLVFR